MAVVEEEGFSQRGQAVLILVTNTDVVCVRLVNDARWRLDFSHCVLVPAWRAPTV